MPWLMVAALFVVTFGVANPIAAFGVFLPVIADDTGWSRGAISVALSINFMVGAPLGFVFGALTDRRGPRLILPATIAIAGLGFGLASTASALWQLYLLIGVTSGVGTSAFYLLAATTVARWFQRQRGLATGIVFTGFNVGFMTGGPVAALLIEHLGWRAAYATHAGVFCGVAAVASLLVRFPPPAPPAAGGAAPTAASAGGPPFRAALRDRRLWCLTASWLLSGTVLLMVSVHIVPFALDRGVELEAASLALTAYGVGAVTGRLVFGLAADRFGGGLAIWLCTAAQMAALTGVVADPPPLLLLACLFVFGQGFAGADTVIVRAVPDVFGVRAIGAVMGVMTVGWRAGAAIGPAGAGFLYDATGSYTLAFGAGPLLIGASLALYLTGWRRR
jgi:MFS family permease